MTSPCLACGAGLPAPFLDLGRQPLANAFLPPDAPAGAEPTHPLEVAICDRCRLIQLVHRVPPESLFSTYAYFSSFSETFVRHARELAESLIASRGLGAGHRVLEIASNDGCLLRTFVERGVPSLGVEPARNIAEEAVRRGVPTLNAFFGPPLVAEVLERFGACDVIIGTNVLAHVPDVVPFLESVARCLKPDGMAVFEVPYVRELLDRTEFDTIYHEHVFYFSVAALKRVASRAGLRLADVSVRAIHGGSLRAVFARGGGEASQEVRRLLADEEKAGLHDGARLAAFTEAVGLLRLRLLDLLRGLRRQGRRLAAYGAPAKGNTLLNFCGIGCDLLEFTVDRSPHKQGLLLPGSRIPILAPEELLRRRPDYTLILPWNIAREVVAQQGAYAAAGGRFLVPIPVPGEPPA